MSHPGPGRITFRACSTTVARYCPLWAYHSLTVLFLGTHEQLPSGSPILGVLWSPSRLTSEFLRNPKPGPDVLVGTPQPGYGSDTKLSHLSPRRITSRARSTTIARYSTSQWVTHPGSALAPFSLNFGVPTEPEASELSKGIVLGRDENIHLRITPLNDVRCHNKLDTSSSINFYFFS
ncbi:unnamed protein product [Malus baccata var. baccata]